MANIKNLIATEASERIVWNSELGHLETGDSRQTLLLTSRPYFSVKNINLNSNCNLLALSGDTGVTIVELPRKWGARYKQEKDNQIYCKTYNLNERLFTCEKRIRINHVAWHPYSLESKQIICILTNDNRLRFHDVVENVELQVVNLRVPKPSHLNNGHDDDDEDDICLGMSMLNMGESAICFDFGPPITVQDSETTFPVYILMGTGDILLIYTNFQNPTWAEHIIGPLTMLPQAEDNYGSDASSLIVLDSSPPMLAIATPTGHVYHCFAFCDKQSLLPRQTLYVYECIELSKDLIENPDDPYSPHVMKLFKDPTSDIRYFCIHQNGVHTIVLPILESLQSGCDITQDRESFAEFLLCTRTSTPSDLNETLESLSTPKGLGVEIRQADIVLLVLMHDNELITQKISPAATLITRKRFSRHSTNMNASRESNDIEILNASQIDAARSNFVEQMELILKRKTSVPVLKLSKDLEHPEKVSQLLEGIVKTFQEEYLKKYNLAVEAIKMKFNILDKDLRNQKKELESIKKRKDEVYSSILVLYSKSAMAQDNQAKIISRMDHLLSSICSGGVLSEAEQKLKREMVTLREKVNDHRKHLDTIVAKHKYDMDQNDPKLRKTSSDLIVSQTQLNRIKETLSRQGADIAELKRVVKSVSKQTSPNQTLLNQTIY